MKTPIFTGAGVAIVTPMNADGSINYTRFGELIEEQIAGGTDAIVVVGTTGEASTMTDEEHIEAIRFTAEKVAKRIPVIAGTGSNDTGYAIELSRQAEAAGADALLQVTPYYNKTSQRGLVAHFNAIADSVNIPVILYNVPSRTGVSISIDTYIELDKNPNIVATKEASGNLEQVDEILKNKPDGFAVLSGDDSLTYPMIACGAEGVISVIGNALPKEFSRMIRLEQRGEFEAAVKIHHKFTDLYSLLFVDGNPAGVKALLHEMGFINNILRLPLVPTRVATVQKMSQILKDLKL